MAARNGTASANNAAASYGWRRNRLPAASIACGGIFAVFASQPSRSSMSPRLSLGAGLPRHDSVFANARHRSSFGAGISAASLPVLMRRIITPWGVDKTLSVDLTPLTGYIVRHQEVSNVRPCLDRGARH